MATALLTELQTRNKKIVRLGWIVLLMILVLCVVFGYLATQNKASQRQEVELVNDLNSYSKRIVEIGFKLKKSLKQDKEITTREKKTLKTELTHLNEYYTKINHLLEELYLPQSEAISLMSKDLKRYHSNFIGITDLIADGNKGVHDNKEVFENQLQNLLRSYEIALSDLRLVTLNEMENSARFGLNLMFYFISIVMLLAIIEYFGVLNPIIKTFQESEELIQNKDTANAQALEQIRIAREEENLVKLQLKTKNAQVLKLQESIEESISTISSLRNDKSLIYLNAASDLEGYLKVVNLQKEIIENQTNIGQNSSWQPLVNAITQLNSMVGDYFKKAKFGYNAESQKEVYLSQLISELILSCSSAEGAEMEQLSDMPSLKTNVKLLKNVLVPFFEVISDINRDKISISAFESGSVCEIKFTGLGNTLISLLNEIEKKELIALSFQEFKIHMAKNSIVERGGAVWTQHDSLNKGVLCLRWIL